MRRLNESKGKDKKTEFLFDAEDHKSFRLVWTSLIILALVCLGIREPAVAIVGVLIKSVWPGQ